MPCRAVLRSCCWPELPLCSAAALQRCPWQELPLGQQPGAAQQHSHSTRTFMSLSQLWGSLHPTQSTGVCSKNAYCWSSPLQLAKTWICSEPLAVTFSELHSPGFCLSWSSCKRKDFPPCLLRRTCARKSHICAAYPCNLHKHPFAALSSTLPVPAICTPQAHSQPSEPEGKHKRSHREQQQQQVVAEGSCG